MCATRASCREIHLQFVWDSYIVQWSLTAPKARSQAMHMGGLGTRLLPHMPWMLTSSVDHDEESGIGWLSSHSLCIERAVSSQYYNCLVLRRYQQVTAAITVTGEQRRNLDGGGVTHHSHSRHDLEVSRPSEGCTRHRTRSCPQQPRL